MQHASFLFLVPDQILGIRLREGLQLENMNGQISSLIEWCRLNYDIVVVITFIIATCFDCSV